MALKKSNIWVTFVRKFIANNFQISPNLVTLMMSRKHLNALIRTCQPGRAIHHPKRCAHLLRWNKWNGFFVAQNVFVCPLSEMFDENYKLLFFLKWAIPGLSLSLFSFFQKILQNKNCRLSGFWTQVEYLVLYNNELYPKCMSKWVHNFAKY